MEVALHCVTYVSTHTTVGCVTYVSTGVALPPFGDFAAVIAI